MGGARDLEDCVIPGRRVPGKWAEQGRGGAGGAGRAPEGCKPGDPVSRENRGRLRVSCPGAERAWSVQTAGS